MPLSNGPPKPEAAASPESTPSNGHLRPKWQLDYEDDSPSRQRTLLGCLRNALPFSRSNERHDQYAYDYHAAASDEDANGIAAVALTKTRRRCTRDTWMQILKKSLYRIPLGVLIFFGIIHIMIAFYGGKSLLWDVKTYEPTMPTFSGDGNLLSYPTDVTRGVLPIPVHSHNDYWRPVPLFDALHWGCTSVEADVWGYVDQEYLLVGHSAASLTVERTLQSLYVEPLVELLDKMNPQTTFNKATLNGVFDTSPDQTLVLLIDFKTNGHDLFPRVHSELEPLRNRGYLSHWDGSDFISRPITIVGTGNAPFDLITANTTYRDIFFDAPLDDLYEPADTSLHRLQPKPKTERRGQGQTGTAHVSADDFNSTNSYYASVSMFASLGLPWTGDLSASQLEKIRGQIRGAHQRGLKSRYWETPAWPTSLRNHIWQVLVDEGSDVLNVDDLAAVATADWGKVGHAWLDG